MLAITPDGIGPGIQAEYADALARITAHLAAARATLEHHPIRWDHLIG